MNEFRTQLGQDIFKARYALTVDETWGQHSKIVVKDVCGRKNGGTSIEAHPLMSLDELRDLVYFITNFMFIPAGRYLYYAGRGLAAYSNCLLYIAQEDTREEWGRLLHSASDALMGGAGIGIDYSVFRAKGAILRRSGGVASGPIPLAHSINEVGRNVRQGGSRRSAILASLNWQHGDIEEFLHVKDWINTPVPGAGGLTYFDLKQADFDAYAPLDSTNITVNYDDAWVDQPLRESHRTFRNNVLMACRNGEPGFAFNFGIHTGETGRNACGEATSSDDSDVCNLGTVNFANIPDQETLRRVVELGSKFLVCGSIRGSMPDEKSLQVREKNRRIGLGIMGVHEWLLRRGSRYEVTPELHEWLGIYESESERAANEHCDRFYISRPKAYRAIAPNGTISLLTGTTPAFEPMFAVAYKKRWIDGDKRRYRLVIDQAAKDLIEHLDIADPDSIETAYDLAEDPERRIKFQADVQHYVDMAISSTINLPAWGSEHNNEDTVPVMAELISKYAPQLRGITFYPDGARGGQPITKVPYAEAAADVGVTHEENSERQCRSGVCGI